MNNREKYLSDHIKELFISSNPVQFEEAFGIGPPIISQGVAPLHTANFLTIMEKIKPSHGGNLIIPLNTIKQYINDVVNNITPK